MKKTIVSFFIFIILMLLFITLFSSCDFLEKLTKNIEKNFDKDLIQDVAKVITGNTEHTHKYKYYYDGSEHWGFCESCAVLYDRETHEFTSRESVAATCENIGYDVSFCSICGYEKTVFEPQKAHEFQTVDGSELRECINCHKKESPLKEIPETERYGYLYLSSLEKSEIYLRIYKKFSAAVATGKETTEIEEQITRDELSDVYHCFSKDHPEYFWLSKRLKYVYSDTTIKSVELLYYLNGEYLSEAKIAFNKAADEVLAGISSSMTDFEKELYIHDYIVKTNQYDETQDAPLTHTAYAALVYKRSVCDGYSSLFSYLLTRCGIQSAVLSGYSGENHSWNAVKIDGDWYMVDPTWDDPTGQDVGQVLHTYFNCSWNVFSADHSFEDPYGEKIENYYDVPECTSEKYYYFTYFGYESELNADDVERVVRAQIEKGQTEKFQIRIIGIEGTPEEKRNKIETFISKNSDIFDVMARALGKSSLLTLSYSVSIDGNVLTLFGK